ncbi:enoyl-CoA delta isomerase 2-like isoform X2 [Bradysia coprophila]|uniref:enoyl-CoA delta isomerase 2-like isoform X2 n=1 Tax=Bradysia coprophila TaxID=38358 RepID=UPI00187DBA80|nr:enoyl-CoA delta isomerase 2-like isoform X2 [Bradysia coprophila]
MECYDDINNALCAAAVDDTVNVVAITGAGDFFSSGNDLSSMDMDNIDELRDSAQKMLIAHIKFPKLLIAVVNGPCIGIAATIVALCDVVYAANIAYFYAPFTQLGICIEGAASYSFPKILGPSKAAEVLLLNHKLTADEALKFKLVSEVFTPTDLQTTIWPRIESFSKLPRNSIMVGKKLLRNIESDKLERARKEEAVALFKLIDSGEFKNAALQFLNRKSKL